MKRPIFPLIAFAAWICVPSAGFAASAVTAESLARSGENSTGAFPVTSLTLGTDGNYYGVAEQGGRFGVGTVFRLTSNGDFAVRAVFDGKENGGSPRAHLLANPDGSFYGTTYDPGTVFRVAPDGALTTVVRFPPGQRCETALIRASDGNLYGTTERTVFRMTPQGVVTQITSFPNVSPIQPPNYHITLPARPSELVQARDGNLYGRTINSVFRITLAGQVTTLSSLGPPQIEGPTVLSPLVEGDDGNFYGVSPRKPDTGGSLSTPVIQQITPDGVVSTFASLGYTRFGLTYTSRLLLDANGNFYGTTFAGGAESLGSVFRVSPSGTLTTLVSFDRANGMFPAGALIKGADGEFFGSTLGGYGQNPRVGPGPNTFGTLYRVTHGGQLTTLYSFPRTVGTFHFNTGPLFQAPDQSFYASDQSEYDGLGSIVRIRPNAAAEIVATDDVPDNIFSTLILGPDGNYYGTTGHGGLNNKGKIIRLSPGDTLETLFSFDGTNGERPRSALLLANDGNMYGTTFYGGASNAGTVFRMTTAGTPQTVFTFDGTNGGYPIAPLIQATDGAFYGTTGITLADAGTIFRLTPQGALSTLVRFDGTNGQDPQNPLLQASDGNFYGSTNNVQGGTIFRMDSNGVLSTLVNFGSFERPEGGLVEGIDGNFYGTNLDGVFRLFPNGAFSLIFGGFRHGLIKGADGAFYGTTGTYHSGAFRLSISAQITGVIVAGSQVVISGQNLHGATEVSVGGVQATSFVVDSPTQITAIFSENDPPGVVSVTAPLGVASFDPHPPSGGLLLNISTRGYVTGTERGVLIAGFIIQGTAPKTVLIRAIGPSLDPRNIFLSLALQDPTLELHDAQSVLAFNDNWQDSQEEAINATGIPPSFISESAILTTLAPGPYTAILRGNPAGTGSRRALVEVYDLSATAPAVLANIATRGAVFSGDDVLIGGFIVGGGGESSTIVVRALGPSVPIDGALQDPTLEFHDSNGNVFTNDNWRDTQEAEVIGASLQPTDDRESVIVTTLAPDSYTAIVRGAGNSSGIGLVEIYHLR